MLPGPGPLLGWVVAYEVLLSGQTFWSTPEPLEAALPRGFWGVFPILSNLIPLKRESDRREGRHQPWEEDQEEEEKGQGRGRMRRRVLWGMK